MNKNYMTGVLVNGVGMVVTGEVLDKLYSLCGKKDSGIYSIKILPVATDVDKVLYCCEPESLKFLRMLNEFLNEKKS
jgi:hypothetical protein